MDRRSLERLRLDRRLITRPGWIDPEDLERELAALPDVSHKAAPPEPREEAAGDPGAGRPQAETRPGR
jgi:hypothetical protein